MLNMFENVLICLVVISSIALIFVNNAIQSLLWLVLVFIFSSILFVVFGAEYISFLIFMIYVGAIAVLFLFMIMMLNIKVVELRSTYLKYVPIGVFVVLFFFFEIFVSIYFFFFEYYFYFEIFDWLNFINFKSNIFLIGEFIYVVYSPLFLFLAIILFISMIGSIYLVVNWSNRRFYTRLYDFSYFFLKKKIKNVK